MPKFRVLPLVSTMLAIIAALLFISAPSAWAQNFQQYRNPFLPSAGDLFGSRLVVLLVAAVMGFTAGAFFSPALKSFRALAGLAILGALALFALFGPYPVADMVDYVAATFIGFVAFGYGIRLGAKFIAEAARRRPRPISFGSAKWADLEHLQENGALGNSGFLLGQFRAGASLIAIRYAGERHLTSVSPTRGGKGVSAIIPNLLTHQGSAFIIDPKGENAKISAYRRGSGSEKHNITGMGQDVYVIDPWNIAASRLGMPCARFNPLDWIQSDDPDAAENAMILADAIVESEGNGESRFWDDESKALLAGVILYVATAPEEAQQRNLSRVRDLLVQTDDDLRETLMAMYSHPHPVVSTTAARTANKDPKLRSNVLASLQSHTHFLDSPRIRESLSASDFKFEDLKSKRITIYLILPADRLNKTFRPWMRLLIQQGITINARNIEEKPEKPILFLLDEMAAIGRLASVEQAYGLMAGFGMVMWGIVQDLSQLARIYGENGWQTFISNSGVIQYFGSRDKMTAEYFSSLCGVTTVEVENFSSAFSKVFGTGSSSGQGGGSSSSHSSTSDTTTVARNEAQRQLAYPDELMVLKGHQQIVFIENLDAIRAEKLVWYSDADLKQHGVDLHAAKPVSAIKLLKAA